MQLIFVLIIVALLDRSGIDAKYVESFNLIDIVIYWRQEMTIISLYLMYKIQDHSAATLPTARMILILLMVLLNALILI